MPLNIRSSFRFFPSSNMGRLLQPSGRRGFPSGRLSAWSGHAFNRYGNCVFNFNHLDACLSWSGRALIGYGNYVLKINHPDGHPHGPDARSLIWKLLAAGVRPSGRQCLTVRTWLSIRKDFQRKSQKFWSHSCPFGRPMSTVWTALVYFTTVAHLNLSL